MCVNFCSIGGECICPPIKCARAIESCNLALKLLYFSIHLLRFLESIENSSLKTLILGAILNDEGCLGEVPILQKRPTLKREDECINDLVNFPFYRNLLR